MALQNDRYTYRVTWSDDDNEYVGLCTEFPSLSWLAATPEAALKGVRKLVADIIKDMDIKLANKIRKHPSMIKKIGYYYRKSLVSNQNLIYFVRHLKYKFNTDSERNELNEVIENIKMKEEKKHIKELLIYFK